MAPLCHPSEGELRGTHLQGSLWAQTVPGLCPWEAAHPGPRPALDRLLPIVALSSEAAIPYTDGLVEVKAARQARRASLPQHKASARLQVPAGSSPGPPAIPFPLHSSVCTVKGLLLSQAPAHPRPHPGCGRCVLQEGLPTSPLSLLPFIHPDQEQMGCVLRLLSGGAWPSPC